MVSSLRREGKSKGVGAQKTQDTISWLSSEHSLMIDIPCRDKGGSYRRELAVCRSTRARPPSRGRVFLFMVSNVASLCLCISAPNRRDRGGQFEEMVLCLQRAAHVGPERVWRLEESAARALVMFNGGHEVLSLHLCLCFLDACLVAVDSRFDAVGPSCSLVCVLAAGRVPVRGTS